MLQTWDALIKEELRMVEEEMERSVRSREELLTEIAMHVITSGGKRMRPGISILAYMAAGGDDPKKIVGLAAAFELIHSATLIHDDINDKGDIRRGKVAAYKKYGVQKALIAGDFLFVQGFRLGGYLEQKVVDIIADACTAMAESEIIQLDHEHQSSTPIEVYRSIIEGKTAKPIEAGARIGAYLAGADISIIEGMGGYGLNIGIAFQIIDDILDITGKEAEIGKRKGLDIVEGKPTLPILLALNDPVVGGRLSELFGKKEILEADVNEALELMSRTDAVEMARQYANDFIEQAKEYLDPLPPSGYQDSLVLLADYILERHK
jgi:octaprenyl-diphosphate synthase